MYLMNRTGPKNTVENIKRFKYSMYLTTQENAAPMASSQEDRFSKF